MDFARTYPAFMIFLLATICFYFAHNMINDFMIQIIRNLGGGEKELGYSNFLQAILELPVMALIGIVMKNPHHSPRSACQPSKFHRAE